MAEPDRVCDALHELRLLTTCRCLPDWTERGMHEPNATCYYAEEVEVLAAALRDGAHEVTCPACGATIRARMADAPERCPTCDYPGGEPEPVRCPDCGH